MSSVGVLELGMSEEGEWFAFFWVTEEQSKIKSNVTLKPKFGYCPKNNKERFFMLPCKSWNKIYRRIEICFICCCYSTVYGGHCDNV